jgi:hypothetical protein
MASINSTKISAKIIAECSRTVACGDCFFATICIGMDLRAKRGIQEVYMPLMAAEVIEDEQDACEHGL